MRSRVVEAEAQIPKAIATAFESGHLGVMDYYRLNNIQSDTKMRKALAGDDHDEKQDEKDENKDKHGKGR